PQPNTTRIVNRKTQNVDAISQGQQKREWLQKYWEMIDGDKQTTKKDHGKTEKVGEGLGFENFTDRHRNKKPKESRSHRNQENSNDRQYPIDAGEINQKSNEQNGNKGIGQSKYDGPGGFGQHQQV